MFHYLRQQAAEQLNNNLQNVKKNIVETYLTACINSLSPSALQS